MWNEQLLQEYYTEFPPEMSHKDISDKLLVLKHENKEEFRLIFCDILVRILSEGAAKYDLSAPITHDSMLYVLLENIKMLPEDSYFYKMLYFAFHNDRNMCVKQIEKYIEKKVEQAHAADSKKELFQEGTMAELFYVPLKNLVHGVYGEIAKIVIKYTDSKEVLDFLAFLDRFYDEANDTVEITLDFISSHPDMIIPKELLAITYQSMKMWRNAIAYYEQAENQSLYFLDDVLHWNLAFCYDKCKDLEHAEEYYKKTLSFNNYFVYARNNLAYCLYREKKYSEAKEILESCLEENWDLPYAANNYVRVLIALKQYKTAKEFVASQKYKISKDIVKRVENLSDKDYKKEQAAPQISEDNEEEVSEKSVVAVKDNLIIKETQFSSEKLLEDELTLRIENGCSVFGRKLKIYRRKGEYGRQYPIPAGRLDLLCEDDDENLYIIELKKDSGYDDAYEQTARYLDWFASSPKFKNKSVYGIICLNAPTEDLIKKIHKDKRMELYEYQIAYTKI